MNIEKIISEELIAFLPKYLAMKGNCSLLFTMDGEVYEVERTIKTVLAQLSRFYLIDLKATKKYYGNILNIKNLIPIPFDQKNIFIPIKVRKPLCRNDGSIGYINIRYIKKVNEVNNKATIYLINDQAIECLSSIDTVNRHIKNGYIVKKLFDERRKVDIVKEDDIYKEYDKPATKSDVALIMNEILKLKQKIRA